MEEMKINPYDDINIIPSNFEEQHENQNLQENEMSIAYESTFILMATLSNSCDEATRDKKLNIICTLFKNILSNPREEKFRKLKLSNKNIQSIFDTDGVYDFFKFLHFEEAFFDNEMYLFLANPDEELLKECLSFIYLIGSEDNGQESGVYIEENSSLNLKKQGSALTSSSFRENMIESDKNNEQNKEKKSLLEVLKESRTARLNQKMTNNWSNKFVSSNKDQIKSILKETAEIRKMNSEQYERNNYVPDNRNYDWNYIGSSHFSNNNNNNGPRIMTLNDIGFKNAQNTENMHKRGYQVNDSIGRQCLHYTNEFRKKNGLRPLEWDDHIWKISYPHSENMGTGKVKFSHDGFNERIKKLPYRYSAAFENVAWNTGYSEYQVAELTVNGWINSPGHRKNLLSDSTHCAIACFRNNANEYYLTQIFIRQ
jgi:uncharacterized protein YkwD